jgi:hypothetical protein
MTDSANGAARAHASSRRGWGMRLRRGGMGGLLAVAVSAGPAMASSVTLDRACYAPGDDITQTGSGFTPSSTVAEMAGFFSMDTMELLGNLTAPPVATDASGAFTRHIAAPTLMRASDREEGVMSSYTDQANTDDPAFVQWTLSNWDVNVLRKGKRPQTARMQVDAFGWTAQGSRLYAHYYRQGRKGKTVTVGALGGPCGNLLRTVRMFPFTAKPGQWKIYFSATRTLDKVADGWVSFAYKVGARSIAVRAAGSSARTSPQRHAAPEPVGATRFRAAGAARAG